ncbi:MAG: LytR cell envelope-related transcriptional attenuator [Solirubrobacterales bacterium]|nr:LytR cell envelope-related transcriptional attenuator [Solirubrobacterales bacterium]
MELIKEIGAFAGLAAFLGLAFFAMLAFSQARDIRRLREWAGSAPERDSERKDTTSVAAAKRAEELKALEESRTAEREALDQREERRRRREAGLPELTRRERLGEGFSSLGSRIAEPRYLVAIFVVLVLVAAGAAYLVTQGSDSANGKGGQGGKSAKATKPSEIEVTVLNGTAVPGLAAEFGNKVEGKGFQLGAVTNSATSFTNSVVMFERGHAPEARKVAKALGISQVRLMSADIESVSGGAPVSVIVGEENATTG